MNIKENQQIGYRMGRQSRKRKKRKKLLPKMLFFMASCFVCFIIGQVFINITQDYSSVVAEATTDFSNIQIVKDSDKNKINTVNKIPGNKKVSKNNWSLILVNPWNKLPDNFKIELTKLKNGQSVDKRIYPELQKMLDDARAEGLSPMICSSFRTMEKQQSLFNNQVNKYIARGYTSEQAKTESAKWVAVPGTSEHQVGLAVDIVSSRYQLLDKKQEETAEQQWLIKNCYKYGFILRYPSDKSKLTGISYEPWHYRYVGKDAAKEIMEKGICLEEYLQNI